MRILYIDIDSLRPDHLGCYGYHRNTSPNIDAIAAEGVRLESCYTTDAPCLPSRTALFTGKCGLRSGVVNHGGVASQPFIEGPERGFKDAFAARSWPSHLRQKGYHTVAISPFGERHSAWHYYAGFNEIHNTGASGSENAEIIEAAALRWLEGSGAKDQWFMHLNFWDPHTPYRVPEAFGTPFADDPLPSWYDETVRRAHWEGSGPHSAREAMGYSDERPAYLKHHALPRQPWVIDDMAAARRIFDGYDTGVRYVDDAVGRVIDCLRKLGVLDQTAIVISSDHGENLGELNVYGDHQTADHITHRIPCIFRWPGRTDALAGQALDGLYYHQDFAATTIELAGVPVLPGFEGQSFANRLRGDCAHSPRDHLIFSQSAWCVQRAARWDRYLYLRTFHDAWHDYPEDMLFDLVADPHEQVNLADDNPDLVETGKRLIRRWKASMLDGQRLPVDPMETTLKEGGSFHGREGFKENYAKRLRTTGRTAIADRLEAKYARPATTTDI